MSKVHYSASQLSTFTRCQLQWKFRYVDGIKSPPGYAAGIGTGTHKGIEGNLIAKMNGVAMPLAESCQMSADATHLAMEGVELADGESVGAAVDQAVALTEVHYRDVAPGIAPIGVEERFTLDPPDRDYEIQGYIDVLEYSRIRDTKTTGKKPPANKADRGAHADQLTLYHMAKAVDIGPAVQLDYLVKTKKPYHLPIVGQQRTSGDHATLLRKYDLMHTLVQAGTFMPTDAENWCCSEKWCGYWDRCEFGARQSSKVRKGGWGVDE